MKNERIEELEEMDRKIVELVKKAGDSGVGTREIYDAVGKNERTVRLHLGKLESMGLIEVASAGEGGRNRKFRFRR
jgi:predicted ArsR family transcriptional regulator